MPRPKEEVKTAIDGQKAGRQSLLNADLGTLGVFLTRPVFTMKEVAVKIENFPFQCNFIGVSQGKDSAANQNRSNDATHRS